MKMINLVSLNRSVRETCQEVAHFIANEGKSFNKDKIEHKGLNDLVSYVDKEAERRLVDACRKILPEAGFITEEGTDNTRKEAYNWIIDPLDGTTNFTHGLPIFSISVALMHNDRVVAGVVHEVNRNESFHATLDDQAYCNDEPIAVSPVKDLRDSLLATGFPYYNFDQMNDYLRVLDTFMQQTHGLRRMGSAAVDLAYVACGRFEGFFEYNLNAWDVAAGAFIVQQAGGMVTDFSGKNDFLFGRQIVAAGPVQAQMVRVIREFWNMSN